MSGQTRSKKGQKDQSPDLTLTKEEQAIAKFLRLKCPNKQGNLSGMKVEFFIGSKLVDCLMESKWGPGPAKTAATTKPSVNKEALLGSRAACVSLMQRLLNKQLFYRAVKIYKEEAEATSSTSSETTTDRTPNLRKRKKEKEAAAAATNTTSENTPKGSPTADTQQKEAKRKFKLELHEDQKFLDSNEPFVWIYDPVSTKTYIIGGLLILGAIGICLFPLWPSQVREGVYYLSLAGASFLGAILAIAACKYVIYGLVYALTMGSISFWIFPNLTEDVGFIESFIPLYKVVRAGSTLTDKSSAAAAVRQEATAAASVAPDEKEQIVTMSGSMTSSMLTRKNSTTITELSKSTVEISTSSRESPSVKTRKQNNKTVAAAEEEDFELVENEDLAK